MMKEKDLTIIIRTKKEKIKMLVKQIGKKKIKKVIQMNKMRIKTKMNTRKNILSFLFNVNISDWILKKME